jgi:anaerobic magnesium-protoporphyrin IX monomethyl ester cyclase
MLTLPARSQPILPMLPGAEFRADVVLVGPRESEVTRAQRTYREKSFTTFTELLSVNAFQTEAIKRINESLGLEALASYLRQAGLTVALLNLNVAPHSIAELTRKIAASGAKVVGISLIYRPQVAQAIDLLEALEAVPDVKVVMGGALASFMPRELLSKLRRLDAVVYGEAEETFRDYCLAVCGGERGHDLPGVAFRDGDVPILNVPAAPLDLLRIVRPARDTLAHLQARGWRTRIASIYTSRGCMANCTFCTGKDAYNVERLRTYRFRDPIDIVDEMQYLHEAFGVQFIYINDDNFLGYGQASRERVRVMAEELLRRKLGIQFASECRVDELDLDLLRLLKEAGLRQVLLGIESGSDSVLKRWRKGATVEQNRKAIETVNKAGIALEPGFILFDAHTNAQELRESVDFLVSTGLDASPMPTYLVNRLSVYPGTEIERLLRADGTLGRSPIRLWGSGNDPAAVRAYFQALEYTCRDPRTEIAWRALRRELEPVESFLEARLQVLTNILLQARGPNVPAQTATRARELIRAAGRWRRTVGNLVIRMIKLVIESYEQPSNTHQMRWLRCELAKAREDHAKTTLGTSCDQFVDEVAAIRRMSATLDLSVVIPTAGKWSRLRRTLDALSRQSLPAHVRWEVVLVLDGVVPPDSSMLARPEIDLRIVSTAKRGGRGYARNIGIAEARAEIVVLLDDDMVPAPHFLQHHLAMQLSTPSVCRGATCELPPLAYFVDLDELTPDPTLAERSGLPRARAWARRALDQLARDPALTFTELGAPSKLQREGTNAWNAGSLAGAVVAFAGANLSAPKRWLIGCPFDERPGTRWGLEDLAVVLRLALDGCQLTVAAEAQALHLSHVRVDWRDQQRANIACLEFLPDAVAETIVSYLESETTLDEVEARLHPYLELARRRPKLVA